MQKLILDFLISNWNQDHAQGLNFSPVPKGQSGDLAINFFALTKVLGQSPVQIAQSVQTILGSCDLLEKTEVSGPYLNLYFESEKFFETALETPLKTEFLSGQTVVVEYSSPNTNKPLHLGHMRNHALGISVSNLYEAVGAKVVRAAIINDRGIHICKSMLAYLKFGNGETPESTNEKPDEFVGRYYVMFEAESKKDDQLIIEAQKMLKEWESGDTEIRKLWKQMNDWTYQGHEDTYKRQGVNFDKKYYESDTYEMGRDFALKGLEDNIFFKKDGAVWIDLTDQGLDEKIIIRSDGTTVYVTQDLATTYLRAQDFNFDQHIWVVADEQNYHFQVLIACLDQLKLVPKEKCFHLGYGLVHLPDGRMKSREGTVVDADNLMDQLKGIAITKIQENHTDFTPTETETIAEAVQNAAWKFYLLKTSPKKTITFEAEKSIDFQGATGPYLQYAGVRIKSIIRKAGQFDKNNIKALSNTEKPLGVKILEWPEVLDRAAEHKNPTYIVTYLLELAQTWSSFYAENSVIKTEDLDLRNARLVLAEKVLGVLDTGLNILGIEIPEKM